MITTLKQALEISIYKPEIAQLPYVQHVEADSSQMFRVAYWINLKSLGYHVTLAGKGSFGFAWDLHNSQVLKITHDKSEAKTSLNILKLKEHKNIIKIYKVGKVNVETGNYKREVFLILEKKYNKLNEVQQRLIKLTGLTRVISRDVKYRNNRFYIDGGDYEKLRLEPLRVSQEDKEQIKKYAVDILSAYMFLNQNGIVVSDTHFNNFAVDEDDNIVLIDLGGGSISQANTVEIIEKINN